MRSLIIIAIVALVVLAVCISAYTTYTDKIIKDQEREIAQLETENKRLKNYINCLNHAARSGRNIAVMDPDEITFKAMTPEGKKVLENLFKSW